MTFLAGNINLLQAKRSRQRESAFSLRLLALTSESVHLPQAFGCQQWKRHFASGFWLSSVETPICLRLLALASESVHSPQAFERRKRETGFCLRFSDPTAASNNFPKAFVRYKKGQPKAEGRDSPTKSTSESRRLTFI